MRTSTAPPRGVPWLHLASGLPVEELLPVGLLVLGLLLFALVKHTNFKPDPRSPSSRLSCS